MTVFIISFPAKCFKKIFPGNPILEKIYFFRVFAKENRLHSWVFRDII